MQAQAAPQASSTPTKDAATDQNGAAVQNGAVDPNAPHQLQPIPEYDDGVDMPPPQPQPQSIVVPEQTDDQAQATTTNANVENGREEMEVEVMAPVQDRMQVDEQHEQIPQTGGVGGDQEGQQIAAVQEDVRVQPDVEALDQHGLFLH